MSLLLYNTALGVPVCLLQASSGYWIKQYRDMHYHITLGPQVYIIVFRYCNIKAHAGMEPHKTLLPTEF